MIAPARIASLLFGLSFVFNFPLAFAAQDGFAASKQLKSRYFTIHVKDGVDLERLAMKAAVPVAVRAVIRTSTADFRDEKFEDQLDLLYLAVREILAVHLKRFESAAKVCNDAPCLSDVAGRLFGRAIQSGGFYVVALDTLYVDSENVTLNILAHELAHAVLTKYFVVPPPEKIQEVLAGFVEYEIRKYSQPSLESIPFS